MDGTRDRILTATNELFRRHGYNGTSLKAISEAADAPIGSIYHFFPGGKRELSAASIEVAGASYQVLFELIADEAGDMAVAVTDFFEGAADVLMETDYLDLCPVGTVAAEVASTDDDLRVAAHRAITGWIDAATARFAGTGLAADEAEELATTMVAALEGSFMLARSARSPEPVRAAGRQMRRLVDHMVAQPSVGSRSSAGR